MNQFSASGLALLKIAEGCELTAYQDQGGVWTIGYGDTGPEIVPGLVWTQAQADEALVTRLTAEFAPGVWQSLERVSAPNLSDNQFSALVVFAYNEGVAAFADSSALRDIEQNDLDVVPAALALWNKVHNRATGQLVVSPGLVGRRAMEGALWALPDGAPLPDFSAIQAAAVTAYENQTR